jgi:hypothetical protein
MIAFGDEQAALQNPTYSWYDALDVSSLADVIV